MKPRLLIKIGGRAAADISAFSALITDVRRLSAEFSVVIVHGGGAEVSEISRRFGYEPVFSDGIRITSDAEMAVVDMVLAGKANKALVRASAAAGVPAVGLSGSDGGLFVGEPITAATGPSRTGRVTACDTRILTVLDTAGFLPIVCSTSMDSGGGALNINADDIALALASAVSAEALVFLSDTPGILKDDRVIDRLDAVAAEHEIAAGVIAGGMIPKVRASIRAIENGVSRIIVGEYKKAGDLTALIAGECGTRITAKESI